MADLRDKINKKRPAVAPAGLRESMYVAPPTVATKEEAEVPSFVPTTVAKLPGVPGPEQVKERQSIQEITAEVPKLEQPEQFDSVMQRINQISTGLPSGIKREFEQQRQKIQQAKDAAEAQYKETRDINQWGQVAETLGQALTQLGAGIYGLKHNVDLSGLKFNKADWSANIDRAAQELDRKLRGVAGEERELAGQESALARKYKEDADFRKKAILQDYMQEQRRAQQVAREAKKLEDQLAKAKEKQDTKAQSELEKRIKEQEKEVLAERKILDRALAEATAAREGAKGASVEKALKALGGLRGEEVRQQATVPGLLWNSLDEDELTKVLNARLKQNDALLQEIKRTGGKTTEPAVQAPVKVISPDGQPGMIPADKVDAALKAGFKRAE